MLNRLIILVFGISLVLALGSTALADSPINPSGEIQVAKFYPNSPKSAAELEQSVYRAQQPDVRKPESALRAAPPGTMSGVSPSTIYFCDLQDYSGPLVWFYTIPDFFGDDLYNTRFTADPGFECTLKVAHFPFYDDDIEYWGSPDVRVYLWDDDGLGFPGTLLDSVDIPNASLPVDGAGYVAADFSSAGWVFSDGAEYHYGFTVIGGAGDTVGILSDNADGPAVGEERSREFYLGAWGTMLNDWGYDFCFGIVSERCCAEIPFSDCYTQTYYAPAAGLYLRPAPHPIYGDSAWAQRFDVGGPETLVSVDFRVFDNAVYPAYTDPSGDQDINITIYADDGFGAPGAIIDQETVPGSSYALYPAIHSHPWSSTLVLEETFHIALSTNGVWVPGDTAASSSETFIADDAGVPGGGRAHGVGDPTWPGGPDEWYTMLDWWGIDQSFQVYANLCRDEFSDCIVKDYGSDYGTSVYPIPDANPITEWAQKFQFGHGAECELRETFVILYRHPVDSTRPNMYTYNTNINVYADAGGVPGALLDQQVLTPADYAAAGYTGSGYYGFLFFSLNWNTVVPPTFYVGIESLAPTQNEGIRHFFAPNGGGGLVDGLWAYLDPDWYDIATVFGYEEDAALGLEAKVCCVPFTGRPCDPPDDWASGSHDLGRTGLSQLAIGDAWCDLTVDWYFETPTNTIQFNAPIVYDGRVFVATSSGSGNTSNVEVFDLYDGTSLGTIGGAGVYFANSLFNDPLIRDGVLYIASGSNRVVSAWDVSTWAVPALPMWSRAFGGGVGPLNTAHLLLLDVGGTEVLYGGSQTGRVFAINASDGLDYSGWSINPIVLNASQVVQNSATDGSQLFFGTYLAGLDGDIWSIDPATGSVNWQLSTAASGGRDALTHYATTTAEQFPSLSYEGGVVYVGSAVSGDYPADGVFYRLDASNGNWVGPTTASPRMRLSTFIPDVNLVYAPTFGRWIGGSFHDYPLYAFSKISGAVVWTQEHIHESNSDGVHFGNAALTCEPEPVADIIITNTADGMLNFWHSLTGQNLFRRRWDYGPGGLSDGTSASLGVDTSGAVHVLGTSFFGGVVSLSKGDDRQRLEIQDYDPQVAVEFSTSTSVIYTVEDILTNTGCADLNILSVTPDENTFGSTDPLITSVRPGLQDVTNSLADKLTANSAVFGKFVRENDLDIQSQNNLLSSVRDQSYRNERGNRAAAAIPPYLNGVVEPYGGQVVAPNDTVDLVLDINSSQIERGPQIFYIEICSDDPDFFLNVDPTNGPSAFLPNDCPELILTLVGGCLLDSTTLEFGVGPSNFQYVYNTGLVSAVDDGGTPFGMEIDGDGASMWMATYLYGVSQHRIAFYIDYFNGTWISWQGDPNWCDNDCKPALSTGVPLGAIWDGSSSYTPITGNMVCASGIDSVQNFFDGSSWDWDTPGPFDEDSTMGLSVNSRTIGAVDEPTLHNLTLEIFEFTERNGNDVDGWKFGFWADYDAHFTNPDGNADTMQINRNYSAAWDVGNTLSGNAWGLIKLPFGCGHEPIKNARVLDSDNSFYGATTGNYLDSFYQYCSLPPGVSAMPNANASVRDQSGHITITERDIAASETFDFGVAVFGMNGLASASSGNAPEIEALANQVNKWAGWGRGDVNNDNSINLGDIMTLAGIVNGSVPGAIPFEHLADVDNDGTVDNADLQYMIDYYFNCGPCPLGDWQF